MPRPRSGAVVEPGLETPALHPARYVAPGRGGRAARRLAARRPFGELPRPARPAVTGSPFRLKVSDWRLQESFGPSLDHAQLLLGLRGQDNPLWP